MRIIKLIIVVILVIIIILIIIILIIICKNIESWENRNNINFSQPITNIVSFAMGPENNSILDIRTPLPEIMRLLLFLLNMTMRVSMEYLLIQLLFMQQFVERIMRAIQIFEYLILLVLECTTRIRNIIQLIYLGGILNILICFIVIFMVEHLT